MAHFMLVRFFRVIDGLVVYPENMKRNMNQLGGIHFSQRLMLSLVESGLTREEAYAIVQRNAMEVWAGEGDLLSLVSADPEVTSRIDESTLEGVFDNAAFVRHRETIFQRVLEPKHAHETGVLAEGKSKRIHTTDNHALLIQEFKDDATAFNGVKKASIESKGVFNCDISTRIYKLLAEAGVPTHLVENLSDTEQLVKRCEVIMIEFVVRNRVAGSLARRYGMEEGPELPRPICEYFVKSDELGDPLIGRDTAEALGLREL